MVHRFIALAVVALLTGCGFAGSVVKSVAYAGTAGMTPAEADAFVIDSIESELSRETAGERPSAGKKDWKQYWQWRYSLWRMYSDGDKWVKYTRNRRAQLGLRSI